jgi:hypothetical protein
LIDEDKQLVLAMVYNRPEVIDGVVIVGLMLISPLVQMTTGIAALVRRDAYLKRLKTLRSVYLSSVLATVPIFTYIVFINILLSMWTLTSSSAYLVVIWSILTIVNRWVLPLTIVVALLPPYPPRTWVSSICRLAAIGTSLSACYMTQQLLPMAW